MRIDGKNNISMTRGDSETITVSCQERPFAEGDKITFTVRFTPSSKEKEIEKTVTEFTEEGKAIIEILPEDTAKMAFGKYRYDIQLTGADETVTTIIKPAEFRIEEEVTYDG